MLANPLKKLALLGGLGPPTCGLEELVSSVYRFYPIYTEIT
jgi:hypothetical protein